MGLDERERRVLAALEERTAREDPALARRFAAARRPNRRPLSVAHLGLLVVALGVLTGVHTLVPDLHGLASAVLTVAVIGPWLVLTARDTPARSGRRPGRERGRRTPDDVDGGPPACV